MHPASPLIIQISRAIRGQFSILFFSFCAACHAQDQPSPPASPEQKFVEHVLLGSEYGDQELVCKRWKKLPKVSVFGGESEQFLSVKRAVDRLNRALKPTRRTMTLLKSNDMSANIRVYMVPESQFPSIAKKHDFKYVGGNLGYAWAFWNGKHEIERAYVLLAKDRLKQKRMDHFALEELTQALGMLNDSPQIKESVVYEDPKKDQFGDATELADIDVRLLRFLYSHVQPGDHLSELRQAYQRYWKTRK